MKDTEMKIEIVDLRSPFRKWFIGPAVAAAFLFGPIYVGIVADSSAMQWAGFFIGFFFFFGLVASQIKAKKRVVHSFEEARRAIDEMEASS